MPNIFEMFKDYVIESEDDIPQKYKEEIEKRLNLEYHTEHSEPARFNVNSWGETSVKLFCTSFLIGLKKSHKKYHKMSIFLQLK